MGGYVQMRLRTGSRYQEQTVRWCCNWAVGTLSEDSAGSHFLLATSTLLIYFLLSLL